MAQPTALEHGLVEPEPVRRRLAVLDALRGVAILLVVLSHGWLLWPTDTIDDNPWLRVVFRNGNFAVTFFLFAAGLLTYRALAHHGLDNARLGTTLARRVLRIAPVTLVVLPVIILVAALDSADTNTSEANAASVWHILTFRWNWYLQTNLADARWDLGHLWYLSVDMQAFVFSALVVYALRRRPVGLVLALLGLLLLFTWWRVHVSGIEPDLLVLLRTTARIDAFLAGVLTAAVLPLLRSRTLPTRHLTATSVTALVLLLPLAWYCSVDTRFLGTGVTLLELALAVLVGAVMLGARLPAVTTPAVLVTLGRNSLPLYVWHYPVFAAVQRNVPDWHWAPRAALAFAVTATLCVASHRLIERRVSRWLALPGWDRRRRPSPAVPSPEAVPSGESAGRRDGQGTQIS